MTWFELAPRHYRHTDSTVLHLLSSMGLGSQLLPLSWAWQVWDLTAQSQSHSVYPAEE
jgi:hypothetical protein